MIGIAFFLVITAVSAGIGYGVFRLARVSSRWISIPASLIATCLVLTCSALAYFAVIFAYPGSEDRRWDDTKEIKIYWRDRKSAESEIFKRRELSRFNPNYQEALDYILNADFQLSLIFSDNPKIEDDATVVLSIESESLAFPKGKMNASLYTAKGLNVWSVQNDCVSKDATPGISTICVNVDGESNSVEYIWTLSSDSSGSKNIAMRFPITWRIQETVAYILRGCGDGGTCIDVLDVSSTNYQSIHSGVLVNLSREEIRFPVEFTTTLGISSETYGYIALLGVILSGALGGGWFFKIVEALRGLRRRANP